MKVLYEDSDILVLDKPAGVIVNRSDTTKDVETVQDFVEKHLGLSPYYSTIVIPEGEFKSPEETFKERSGIVHRLDKETSGALLVAKTREAFIELQRQFKERIVEKTYRALAHGKIQPAEGEVNVPVGRLEFNRKRFGVVAGGRESKTRYRVISNFHPPAGGSISKKQNAEILSLVELYPKTGRTHQIRVHLKHINHPIFSDELYAGRKVARQDRKALPRIFLHAAKIIFLHPRTGEKMEIESPLPKELKDFISMLS